MGAALRKRFRRGEKRDRDFFQVFPEGTIWSNDQNGKGYDVVLLGQAGETKINLDELDQRLEQPEFSEVAQSLQGVGFQNTFDLFATYAGNAHNLAPWLADAQINRDRNLRLQYLAGFRSNWYHSDTIYDEMAAYLKYPDQLFTGSDISQTLLRIKIAAANIRSK